MDDNAIRSVVVVGGGTAGWMAASACVRQLGARCKVRLVESEEIGIVGVGEATVPHIRLFNSQLLGLDEAEFIRATQGTFKLGIEFRDWGRLGARYHHGFGSVGHDIGPVQFHHYWLRARALGRAGELDEYGINAAAARAGRFLPGASDAPAGSPLAAIPYAYHFDAGLYAKYLRGFAEKQGVQRHEGKIVQVVQRAGDGFVEAVVLESGERIEGDLFIDCSGFRGLLIEGAMQAGYEDWRKWLPCDRALAVSSDRTEPLRPYTTSTAHAPGWQWTIPLQHRTGSGLVYNSGCISDDEASALLVANLEGKPQGDPKPLRFVTGRRKRAWVKNVVAIGLASGFLEPLESTSIHIIMDGVGWLVQYFPDRDFHPALANEFNRHHALQFESTRDFIALHYHLTRRDDSELWRYCAQMELPETLAHQIDMFRGTGRVVLHHELGFLEPSWVSIYLGLGLWPERLDPFVEQVDEQALLTHFMRLRQAIAGTVAGMPVHADYIERHVKADPPAAGAG